MVLGLCRVLLLHTRLRTMMSVEVAIATQGGPVANLVLQAWRLVA